MTTNTDQLIERIKAALADDRLAVLAGAGISMGEPAKLPSWRGLVERMAAHMATYSEARAAAITEQLESDLLAAIDLYEIGNKIPPVERARFLREQFQTANGQTTATARALAGVEASIFLTTNYDAILRTALSQHPVEVLSNGDEELHAALSLLGTQRILVHLHGKAVVPESMVLGSASYQRLTSRESYKQLLRGILLRYSVLAVGFSFADPPFRQLLEYIATELGAAGSLPHVAIIGASSNVDRNLLTRANFEIVQYDDSKGHGEVERFLERLHAPRSQPSPSSTRPRVPPAFADTVTLELSRIYASLTARHRGQAFDLAAAALVAHGLSARPQNADVLATKLSRTMALSVEVASALVARGVLVLRQSGSLEENGPTLRLKDWRAEEPPRRPLVDAINARLAALDKRIGATGSVRAAALDVVKRVMLVQGMTAAKAFIEADPPDAYLLEKVVRDAVVLAEVPSAQQQVVRDAVTQVLRSPTKDVSRELFELAHAAFALETVFLNPAQVDLGTVLAWQLYLDSNIVMRLLHPSCDASETFQPLLSRLQRLRIPLTILRPFLDEIIAHADMVERQVNGLASDAVQALLRATPQVEQSPLLRWFSFLHSSGKRHHFRQFREENGLIDLRGLIPLVEGLGIEADRSDAIRVFDTADRETLWHDLREFRARDQSTQGARRLRRAEATQVMWLAHLRASGTRAWFLSQDGQLRRALKYIQQGRYAGYVATPAAWMMKLAEIHWGDVDVAGFSELMWVVPLSKPTERLREEVAREVLRQVPDLGGEHPEWLRDRIEGVLEKNEPLMVADMNSAGSDEEEEKLLAQWSAQVVPPAVSKILDELARRLKDGGSGSRGR